MNVQSEALCRFAALMLSACTPSAIAAPPPPPPPPDAAAIMLGQWSYDSVPRIGESLSLNTGVHVRIAIDSVRGMRFWGTVALWLSGDVLIAPSQFGRVVGSVDDHGDVQLTIPHASPAGSSIMLTGNVAGDVLTVNGCSSGDGPGPFPSGAVFERDN